MQGFFDQVTSYHIALDLLYKKGMYDEMLKVFDLLQDRQLYGSKYPRECVVLALAACYKLVSCLNNTFCFEEINKFFFFAEY